MTRPIIMGILNVTPDSFSDGDKFNNLDSALFHTEEMLKDGADIIDVGGESTRPGYTLISDEEEIGRVVPVIEAIRARFDTEISLDTYKTGVAKAGIAAGINYLNDIWGLKWATPFADDTSLYELKKEERQKRLAETESPMAKLLADHKEVKAILMHNRAGLPYEDTVSDVIYDMKESVDMALAAGMTREQLILDPGIGFAKTTEDNLILMKHMDAFVNIGYPVLLGISRKSMIGNTLDLPKDQRLEGTIASDVVGLMAGCEIFRVHDVKENKRALDMTWAIMQAK